jgi:transposase-like protein
LAALKCDKPISELAEQFAVHPSQITDWKQQLQENAATVFGERREKEKEPDTQRMQAKINLLTNVRFSNCLDPLPTANCPLPTAHCLLLFCFLSPESGCRNMHFSAERP